MTTLLTGFNRFGDLEVNPTQLIVESMAKRPGAFTNFNLVVEVLPTEFIVAGNRISQLIRQHRPEMVVCLGVGAGLGEIHLERVGAGRNRAWRWIRIGHDPNPDTDLRGRRYQC